MCSSAKMVVAKGPGYTPYREPLSELPVVCGRSGVSLPLWCRPGWSLISTWGMPLERLGAPGGADASEVWSLEGGVVSFKMLVESPMREPEP
jgi:hypothetical protein